MNYFKFGKFVRARNVGEQAKVSFSGWKCGQISKCFSV